MSSKYLQSIQEVRQWLGYKKLDEFIYILLDNGYDDLDSIAHVTESELEQLKDLFQTSDTKKSIETLVTALRDIGIDTYRKDKNQFKNITSGGAIKPPAQEVKKTSGIGAALAAKSQAEKNAQNIERRGGGTKKDIVSVRTHKQSNWSDKYVVLDGYQLKFFNSRRDPSPDQTFALDQSLNGLEKADANTLKLVLSLASTYVEMWCPEPEDIEEWETELSKCLPVASPKNDNKPPALPIKHNKKSCPVTGCDSSPFGKGPYCSVHQNQYGRDADKDSGDDDETPASSLPPPSHNSDDIDHDDDDDDEDIRPPSNDGNNRTKFEQHIRASMSMTHRYQDDDHNTKLSSGSGMGGLEDDMEESKMDRNSWEGVMSLHALFRAKLHLAHTIYEKVDELELEKHYIKSSAHDNKAKKYMSTLAQGAIFKKFKRGSSATRRIWCTPLFDFVVWGDEDKANVKGFIATTDIQEINQGFGKNKCRIYVVSAGRTLELEAKDSAMAKEWKTLFEFLIQANIYEQEHKKRLAQRKDFIEKKSAAKSEFSKLLVNGDVFKKWPGRKSIQKGSVTSRKIWADQTIEKLQWGDIATNKVKGYIEMADVVQIEEDPTDKLKFTVFAQKRSLDLEAKSVWVREKWVRALRYFVEFKPKKT